ncbi:MAG: phage major capsid protein [Phycicoccus sp.]
MNAYLAAMIRRHDEARDALIALQASTINRAEDGTETVRALSDAEQTDADRFTATCAELAPRIQAAAEQEQRALAVGRVHLQLRGEDAGPEHAGPGVVAEPVRTESNTTAVDRDPGHYRSVVEGGQHSFFADMYRSSAQLDDGESKQRLQEHARALASNAGGTGLNAGTGLIAPQWLTQEYETKARFGRALANAVRQMPITNPAPMTFPGQVGGTDAVVAEQATENIAPGETDAYTSGTVTVAPKPTTGAQVFSRQMLDMATPAIDSLIYGDLLAVYDDKVEAKVCATALAAAGTAVATFATVVAFVGAAPATPGLDALTDTAIAVRTARKLPANAYVMGPPRWGTLKKLRDTAGRPLLPNTNHGPQNVYGLGDIVTDGEHEGIPIIVTEGLGAAFPENILGMRLQDTILMESPMMRFRFEEVLGPQSIRIGIWAYTAAVVRQATLSVRRITITAA